MQLTEEQAKLKGIQFLLKYACSLSLLGLESVHCFDDGDCVAYYWNIINWAQTIIADS